MRREPRGRRRSAAGSAVCAGLFGGWLELARPCGSGAEPPVGGAAAVADGVVDGDVGDPGEAESEGEGGESAAGGGAGGRDRCDRAGGGERNRRRGMVDRVVDGHRAGVEAALLVGRGGRVAAATVRPATARPARAEEEGEVGEPPGRERPRAGGEDGGREGRE